MPLAERVNVSSTTILDLVDHLVTFKPGQSPNTVLLF